MVAKVNIVDGFLVALLAVAVVCKLIALRFLWRFVCEAFSTMNEYGKRKAEVRREQRDNVYPLRKQKTDYRR